MTPLLPLLALSFPAPAVAADANPALEAAPLEPVATSLAFLEPRPLADEMPQLEYTFLELNYLWTDSDGAGEEFSGAEFIGSLELPLNFFLQGAYIVQEDNSDLEQYRLGAGWHIGIIPRLDLYALLSYTHFEIDGTGFEVTSDGAAADIGARFMITSNIEINGAIKWIDVDDEQSGVSLGGRFYFTDALSFGARADILEDDTSYGAGLRFEL